VERERNYGCFIRGARFVLRWPPLSPVWPPSRRFRLVNSRSKANVELTPAGTTTLKVSHGYEVYSKT